MKARLIITAITLVSGLFLALPAHAELFTFYNISSNNAINAATAGQFTVEVSDAGGGQASFQFSNLGPAASSITDVYFDDFDDGVLAANPTITESGPGVDFALGASPPNLPAGQDATPPFDATYSADSTSPTQPNGANPGEWVSFLFSISDGNTWDDVISAVQNGNLRLGIHVQGYADGGSESFINHPTPVPEPAAMLLLGIGLVGLAGYGRKRLA